MDAAKKYNDRTGKLQNGSPGDAPEPIALASMHRKRIQCSDTIDNQGIGQRTAGKKRNLLRRYANRLIQINRKGQSGSRKTAAGTGGNSGP